MSSTRAHISHAKDAYFFLAVTSASRISLSRTSVVEAGGGGAGFSAFFNRFEILTSWKRMKAMIRNWIRTVMKLP